jgi:hypothetical protein
MTCTAQLPEIQMLATDRMHDLSEGRIGAERAILLVKKRMGGGAFGLVSLARISRRLLA